jgi:hypothetical protein
MRPKNFKTIIIFILSLLILLILSVNLKADQKITTPEEYFGFKPGADRMLLDYEQLIGYLKKIEKQTDKLKLIKIGKTPLGKDMFIAFISSHENLKNLYNLKKINKELALNPNLTKTERKKYLENGKVFVLGTLSMHSGEVGPSQAAPVIAYKLVTTESPKLLNILNKVVYAMVPCHNPDGMDMVVKHYRKYKGTKYEGASMPGVYHKYVGHDNNRDFVSLTQKDTKAIARISNKDWFPQVMVEKHQMGSTTARYFVPPFHDPIAENIDAGIWDWIGVFGSSLMKDMTKDGCAGVSQHYLFDDYWPGSTETPLWKNVISMLTECASAKYATPVFVEQTELNAHGKGLSEYKKSVNMPLPWKGGWWRLSDIVKYEISSTFSILNTVALHKKEILKFRNDMCRKEVNLGKTTPPYYYILPKKQHDESEFVALINLLDEHGVNVYKLSKQVVYNNTIYNKGDIVIPLAQPFRAFIKEIMEKQNYPVRHYTPDGKIIKPYDITSWSLPLHRGVKSIEIKNRIQLIESALEPVKIPFSLKQKIPNNYKFALFNVNNNESYKAVFLAKKEGLKVFRLNKKLKYKNRCFKKGSFIIKGELSKIIDKLSVTPFFVKENINYNADKIIIPRIALVETFFHDMDAGWTRFIFDTYFIPYKVLHPRDFSKIDFEKNYDIVIFPDANSKVLMSGKYGGGGHYYIPSYPPEYTKGIGKKGLSKIVKFINNGGTVISWGQSTKLFLSTLSFKDSKNKTEQFNLPISDISSRLRNKGLYCPGSLVKINLVKNHPLTFGMEGEIGVFFRGRPVFATRIPSFDMDRRVIGFFPKKDIVKSGYCENCKLLENHSVLVWLKKNRGQLIMFGFNPQFRASTPISYKLIFNSILMFNR